VAVVKRSWFKFGIMCQFFTPHLDSDSRKFSFMCCSHVHWFFRAQHHVF
jgi:hypothetical protein